MTEPAPDAAPTIRTDRLWLTPFSMDDADAVYAYASIPETSRYTTWSPHTSVADAEDFLRYALGERYCWAIRLEERGPAVGAVECTGERPGENSIHYVLAPAQWGRGIMTEAARAVLDWAFASRLDVQTVTTAAIAEHAASRRVLEKCGMEMAGLVSERWEKFTDPVELAVYRLTRDKWQGRGEG